MAKETMPRNRTSPVYVATGPYGLVGRWLFDVFPGLIPIDLVPAPAELRAKMPPAELGQPVDISVPEQVQSFFQRVRKAHPARPLIVFHLAAITDTKSADASIFQKVNVTGTANVLKASLEAAAHFVHISTDYVFEAENRMNAPYKEEERPLKTPSGIYAFSKFKAENLVLDHPKSNSISVVRIAFPYGGEGNRPGLAGKMIARFEEGRKARKPVKLFQDQFTCPSYVPDIHTALQCLSEAIQNGKSDRPQIFHAVGDKTTPMEFGTLVQKTFGYEDVGVEPVSVKGTPYAQNLWLSGDRTRSFLGYQATSHWEALEQLRRRRFAGSKA